MQSFAEALGVRQGDVVVFSGAGGKTTALFRLGEELAAAGLRVVSTTTTRIGQDELRLAPGYLAIGQPDRLPPDLPSLLARYRHLFVFKETAPPNKARGFDPAWVDEMLASWPGLDVLLVEADGARRQPLKAPQPHEPAMPASTTLAVPVLGLSALGQPLDEEHAYNSAQIAQQTGYALGALVTPEVLAAVLGDPAMGLKDIPPGARVVPLLNQLTAGTLGAARDIGRRLLAAQPRISRVVAGALGEEGPEIEAYRRVTGVVLAAGLSARMGEAKLLLPWGEGSTIIRETVVGALAAGLPELIVVTGAWQAEVEAQLVGLPVRTVHNPNYLEGEMISSLQAALRAASSESEAVLVFLGDQPAIEPPAVQAVLAAYAQGCGQAVMPAYQGRRGHPVLFDRALWDGLLALPPGRAPRDLLREREAGVCEVPVDTPSVLLDIDTPDDYARAKPQSS